MNNYLGKGERMAFVLGSQFILFDLFSELRSSLRCVAVNKKQANEIMEKCENDLICAAANGVDAIDKELNVVAER